MSELDALHDSYRDYREHPAHALAGENPWVLLDEVRRERDRALADRDRALLALCFIAANDARPSITKEALGECARGALNELVGEVATP